MNEKTVFTISETAQILKVCEETIRRRIRDGSLKAAKIGKEYRISIKDIEEFFQDNGGGTLFGTGS